MPSPASSTEPRLTYSPAEAAALVGCTSKTIYRWMSIGLLASTKVGGLRLIPRAELERLVTPSTGDAA